MTKVEKYTQEAIAIAQDNSHGYSMANRNGNPDYDCSSLVCNVVQNAGIPVMSRGASFTGNMLPAFLSCGFDDVTYKCNLANGSGMMRGDILLNVVNHTAIYIGSGQVVHARGSDGHPEPGDQTGNEIRTQSYWNYPWDYVLRYTKDDASDGDSDDDYGWAASTNNYNYPEIVKYGDKGSEVMRIQNALNSLGYNCGVADGDFGKNTLAAVEKFQADNNLFVDGEVGPNTFTKLNEALAESESVDPATGEKEQKEEDKETESVIAPEKKGGFKISRWQVFDTPTGDVVICKNCEAMFIIDGGEAPDNLVKYCPVCGAYMIGRTCWFPPKE